MSEIFDEVNEEVRREQLKKLWERYAIVIIAVAVLIVGGVGGWRAYQYFEAQKAAQAGAAFDKAAELSDEKKSAEAETAFVKLAETAPSGYRTLARLRAAGELADRAPDDAAKMFDAIAADNSVRTEERDLARLRAAGILLDKVGYDAMLARLEPATQAGSTFRHSARELLALSAWRANDTTAARKWIDAINEDGESPAGLRSRAEALQALLPPAAKS